MLCNLNQVEVGGVYTVEEVASLVKKSPSSILRYTRLDEGHPKRLNRLTLPGLPRFTGEEVLRWVGTTLSAAQRPETAAERRERADRATELATK